MCPIETRTHDDFNDLVFRQYEIKSELKRLEAEKEKVSINLLFGTIGSLVFTPETNVRVRELAEKIAALNKEYDAISVKTRAMLKEGVLV